MPKKLLLLLVILLLIPLLSPTQTPLSHAQTDGIHPRLWIRESDLPRLRAWASADNPLYAEGIEAMAWQAVQDMDNGLVPAQDTGSAAYEEYPTESYALLFAFMSLIDPDEAARQDYAQRARTLLMYVMNEAVKGVDDNAPFRQSYFSINDRSRWTGASFGLTVDWIYPYLSAEDKVTIRTVFLRWSEELLHADTTTANHPEPIGLTNDPALISDRTAVRWSGNNYYSAHMRNLGLMALSFDPADDPDGQLGAYLSNATGAWLYVADHLLRTDAAGGLGVEGFEYSPQSVGYVAQFLLALYTANITDTSIWGEQIDINANPFWQDSLIAFASSNAPRPTVNDYDEQIYLPAWYGSGQNYWTPDMIELFGPLGIHADLTGNTATLDASRWLQLHTPPGGATDITGRVRDTSAVHKGILYFLLYDPQAATIPDPRPNYPTAWYASGMRRLLARSDWTEDAAYFTYNLSWDEIDHQSGNGNAIEFYRDGEWLTKIRVGYDFDYHSSDNMNTLTVTNTRPNRDDFRLMLWERGSQWLYSAGEPSQPLISIHDAYIYAYGDATPLYNSEYEELTAIEHVSRSVVWLKPDIIVIYDRAITDAENPQAGFWLNFPDDATVTDNLTTMTTASGQHLYITTLLPENPQITVNLLEDELSSAPAHFENMRYRLHVTPTELSGTTQFLHVLQGGDADSLPLSPTFLVSSSGAAYQGVEVDNTAILFPVDSTQTPETLSYTSPATRHIITGLAPNTAYDVTVAADGLITVTQGSSYLSDSGGSLLVEP